MPKKQMDHAIAKKCEICCSSIEDAKKLGPFIETKTVAGHYNCILFSPVKPDDVDLTPDGICGVSARFIRTEGKRARPLVIFFFSYFPFNNLTFPSSYIFFQKCVYCKRVGANIGCCRDVGTDAELKFCHRRYHVDCGIEKGASFTITSNCGTVSVCFEHRDAIER